MAKTILITGSTDGIGLETARMLAQQGHRVLLHGRSEGKLKAAEQAVSNVDAAAVAGTYRADLSRLGDVMTLASAVAADIDSLDALINNAGVFKMPDPTTESGLDARFVVNTIAPYLLTQRLLPRIPADGRVVNLSSAAQAPVDLEALQGNRRLGDSEAYAQSKLAITMWTAAMAQQLGDNGPAIIAVNPASFLGSKMVKDAYGMAGGDLSIGADILVRAALSPEFAGATGKYYDNDNQRFASPHPDALDAARNAKLVELIEQLIESASQRA